MPQLVSVREFSRRIGCSDVAVHKAIKSGKITRGYVEVSPGKFKIDPDVAASEWGKNFDPSYTSNPKIRESLQQPTVPELPAQGGSDSSIASAKRAQAILKAKLLDLELREKQGQLVDKQQVYKQLFEMGQQIRSAILTVPDRIIDNLMACNSRNEGHTMLMAALIDELEKLSNLENKDIAKGK